MAVLAVNVARCGGGVVSVWSQNWDRLRARV
jgi:hypothetical protein